MLVSLLYLLAMQVRVLQTSRDVAGAGISVAVAGIALLALRAERQETIAAQLRSEASDGGGVLTRART